MQKILFPVFAMLIFSCNNSNNSLAKPDPEYKNWKIDKVIGEEMVNAYLANPCSYTIKNRNGLIRRKINKKYKPADYKIEIIPAKHTQTNADNYARLRGFPKGDERAMVNTYCTELIRITPKTLTATEGVEYYDIYTICPPPPGENCQKNND